MKSLLTLLEVSTNDQVFTVILWIVGVLIGLVFMYYFLRMVFSVNKRVGQNDEIIELLKKLQKPL